MNSYPPKPLQRKRAERKTTEGASSTSSTCKLHSGCICSSELSNESVELFTSWPHPSDLWHFHCAARYAILWWGIFRRVIAPPAGLSLCRQGQTQTPTKERLVLVAKLFFFSPTGWIVLSDASSDILTGRSYWKLGIGAVRVGCIGHFNKGNRPESHWPVNVGAELKNIFTTNATRFSRAGVSS